VVPCDTVCAESGSPACFKSSELEELDLRALERGKVVGGVVTGGVCGDADGGLDMGGGGATISLGCISIGRNESINVRISSFGMI
jgi:mannose/fructose/N-acetylgalactosamine-specific phosphotransferase system component IIC